MILKNKLRSWVCLSGALSMHATFAGTGIEAYREGQYIKASQELATSPSHDSLVDYYMARMQLYGYGQLKNNRAALYYFQKAAEKGFLPAQRTLALYALLKENNPSEALIWFKKAAENNDVDAQLYTAAAYLFGVGVKKNTDLAKRYYIAAAKNGNSLAQGMVAKSFLDTRDSNNKKLGLLWLNKAVAQKNPEAQLMLASLYEQGKLVELSRVKAKELIDQALAQDYLPAVYQMGVFFEQEKNLEQAKNWYTKAANAHYAPAEMALTALYRQEKTPYYNLHVAFLWTLRAAQNGSLEAQQALVGMYQKGEGVEKDESVAKSWQKKAAETAQGTPALAQAQAALWLSFGKSKQWAASGYHLKGILSDWRNPDALKENNYLPAPHMDVLTRGALYKPNFIMTNPNDLSISEYYDALAASLSAVSTDVVFPRYAIDKSFTSMLPGASSTSSSLINKLQGRAALGDSNAEFTLGQLLEVGIGVPRDVPLAMKTYELASAQQDLRAEYNVGLIYLEGRGVDANYEKATALLKDAAFKGNAYAQYALARMNEVGYRNAAGDLIIKPDLEEAMAMYDLAAANEDGLAKYRLAEMMVREKKIDLSVQTKQNRDRLVKKLYEGAFASGVQQAALPLAFFNAMDPSSKKQQEAFSVATAEAKAGNGVAALLLGLLYDRGIAVPVNQAEALNWYQKAPSNVVISFILGTYLSQGTGLSQDLEKGKALLEQAATGGFSYAHLNLGVMKHQQGEPFLPELDKAIALDNSKAQLLLADYYLSLASTEVQMKQARDIYQQLAAKGDKEGQLKLGYMQEHALGGVVDRGSALKWYTLSAEQGQVVAQYLLARLYQLGEPTVLPDYALAKTWYSRAENSYAPAAVALGFVYDTVDDDYHQAFLAYSIAAEKQDRNGQYNLGLLYEKGKGRPVDVNRASELYRSAAEKGHAQAMVQLAGLYFNGLLGERDEDQALDWTNKAAALGNRDALYQLGLLSETGVSTKLDLTVALHNYQLAASKGHAKARLALARMYQYGLGVPKNSLEALNQYKILATLDNAYAQYQLALLYYQGVEGKRLPVEGKQWLQRASVNGSQEAISLLQWLDAQKEARKSFIEPVQFSNTPSLAEQPADLMYLEALSAWNRGDERSSKGILDVLMAQFPEYSPAKRAYEQLNQLPKPASILG